MNGVFTQPVVQNDTRNSRRPYECHAECSEAFSTFDLYGVPFRERRFT